MANIPVEPRRRSPLVLIAVVALVAALAIWFFSQRDRSVDSRPPAQAAEEAPAADPLEDAVDAAGSAAEAAGRAVQEAAEAAGDAVEEATDGQ